MSAGEDDEAADRLRHEQRQALLQALAREGISYPPERMPEAVAEYAQLQRLIAVVNVALAASADEARP